jgi:MFS transporter, DHA1 family, tetracycline resistance protein
MTETKLDFKRILPIFVIVLVDLLGLTIIIPLLPLYATAFGANALMIGVIGAAYPLMQLIGSPILGSLSDRYGRKPVLVVSQIGTCIGFLLLGIANAIPLLIISRLIDGISGGNIVTAQAAITDSTTPQTRAQGLGLIGAAFGLGFVLGPAIAGIALWLTGNDYRVPAFIAAGFSFISILLTLFWFQETYTPDKASRDESKSTDNLYTKISNAFRNPLIGLLLILMFSQHLVFGSFEQFIPLFTLRRLGMDGASNAILFVFVGILLVLIQGKYIGPLSRRFGEVSLIKAGLAAMAVGLIMTAITPQIPVNWYEKTALIASFEETASAEIENLETNLPDDSTKGWLGLLWILLAMIPAAFGGGVLSPSINSLITKSSSPAEIGTALGVSSAFVSAANAITPLIGGSLFQFFGTTAPFFIGGLALLLLLGFILNQLKPQPVLA